MNLKILDQAFFGNRILDYTVALLTLSLSVLFVKMVIRAFIKRLKKFAEKTTTTFDGLLIKILERIVLPGLYLSCIYLGLKTLKMPSGIGWVINTLQLAVVTFFATRIVIMFLGYSLDVYLFKRQEDSMLEHKWGVNVGIGAVTFAEPPATVDEMVSLADAQMYIAKGSGKNTVKHVIFDKSMVNIQLNKT